MNKTNFREAVVDANPIIPYLISTHLWLEYLLICCLEVVLPNPEVIFGSRNPPFRLLVDLCEAHRVLSADFANVLGKVNALRNKFAHRAMFEPKLEEIKGLIKALREMEDPFLVSSALTDEHEMAIALTAISRYLEEIARDLGAENIGAANHPLPFDTPLRYAQGCSGGGT